MENGPPFSAEIGSRINIVAWILAAKLIARRLRITGIKINHHESLPPVPMRTSVQTSRRTPINELIADRGSSMNAYLHCLDLDALRFPLPFQLKADLISTGFVRLQLKCVTQGTTNLLAVLRLASFVH